MAFHCNPMAFNFRIPSFVVAFLRVYRWVVHYASMQFRHLLSSVRRILKRGGLFWKSEMCANDLDSNFHWSWMSRKARKFKAFFCPKSGDLKKKKKKKVFAKIQSDFSAEIRNSKLFSTQNQVISKKKKNRFSPELTQISSRKPDAQFTKGGGHASILLTLLCNFAILATQRGGPWHNGPP